MAYIRNKISLAAVKKAEPEIIYFGVNTCWWTHDPRHLCTHPENGLPCDPRGGMLMQSDKPSDFFRHAEANPNHYGKHGLKAFMAAHHLNCVVSREDARGTCLATWEEYNNLLDEQVRS